jgi:hypothetical protein
MDESMGEELKVLLLFERLASRSSLYENMLEERGPFDVTTGGYVVIAWNRKL